MRSCPRTTFFLTLLAVIALAGGARAAETREITSSDGVMIHTESSGSGPTVVLVHGWSCDSTYWREQVPDLARDHQVVTVDLAGHGMSGADRTEYTIPAFGQDVAAALAAWDLHDAILVGHSMGGPVVVEAAAAAPDRVRGLVGIDNFQQVNFKVTPEMRTGFLGPFEANFARVVPQWVGQMFPADADSALRADIGADMAAAPRDVALSAMGHLLDWFGATPEHLAALQVNLVCVNGDKEPVDRAAIEAVVPAYELWVLPGTGHFLFLEKPEAFNGLLREALASFE